MVKEQELEIIKSRTLVLKAGERSGTVWLVDPEGGDIYLTFELRHIGDHENLSTHFTSPDAHHVDFVIYVRPHSTTRPSELLRIGDYGAGYPLYLGFVVQPQISGEHSVIVTFCKGRKERSETVCGVS